ncbi:hypothetical protein SAMN05216582_10819 [Selenomonas ruminantium]|uniref:Uncharacterized protein n=1 Tax=Selenomonas ruminantium TaxID=971 RepID=A0A1M6TJY9_SELRU|nr:hypothetical protein [Selenomonas ruminantium]SHK57257.1 hypothetical protein SAMN05216582_10819 [Selenomonas ruminantium]
MRYRWFVDEERQTDEFGMPVSRAERDERDRTLPSRSELYQRREMLAIVAAFFILLYEWITDDSPVAYICVAFLTFELRPLAKQFLGERGQTVSNALAGFSVAMFLAAVVWAFL